MWTTCRQSFTVITDTSERLSLALLLIPKTVWECAYKNSWPWGCHYWKWHCNDIVGVLIIQCHANGFRSKRNGFFYKSLFCSNLDTACNLSLQAYVCVQMQKLMRFNAHMLHNYLQLQIYCKILSYIMWNIEQHKAAHREHSINQSQSVAGKKFPLLLIFCTAPG